jgi:subtilisin family serine protease
MKKFLLTLCTISLMAYGCSTTETATSDSTSAETTTNTDTQNTPSPEPVDFESMLEPPQGWHHFDEEQTRFRGISSQRAYETILSNKSPQKEVVVAILDGGIDADHEDLSEVMWVNEDEIPGNGKDDDGNGYVDDIHGWNFIGGADGENVNHDTFELTRIYRKLHKQFGDMDSSAVPMKQWDRYEYYKEIRADYKKEVQQLEQQYNNIASLEQSMKNADEIMMEHFGSADYSYEQVQELEPSSQELNFAKNVMSYVMENDIDSTLIADQKKQIYEFAKYGYNPDFNPRNIVGDNYEDKDERYYGNNDVAGPDPSHGTHVAGIVAAMRNNGIGTDGVATSTRIMAVRTVPNGDERDKDVANAIRYAVDNGADIINMSFGKGYSPYKEVVDRAVQYADEHGVLMVHGAGNEAQNNDQSANYPTDIYDSMLSDSSATLWLEVGATGWKPNENFVANFSNYGNQNVDIFAPGVDIYSTMPDNEYKFQEGTSMASPVVAGSAALIMAYYPQLSPRQVRQLLMEHSVKYPDQEVIVPHEGSPDESETVLFPELSVSDGVVNVQQALQAAEEMSQ